VEGARRDIAGAARALVEPFARRTLLLFLELNLLLYAGVLAFVAGLGWTVATWSQQLGDVLILTILFAILAACFWYCFARALPWSPVETPAPSPVFDYVLYLGCLVWCIELAYLENRFGVLSGQWDIYLLATAIFFFILAYRFDNRFVLSLALSSLAGWLGLSISHWPSHQDAAYRQYALLYCLLVSVGGVLLQRRGLKLHFFGTYLNMVANVLFWAVPFGVFEREGYGPWFLALLIACGASLAWGLTRRQFAFVAYSAVYGYVGVSAVLIRGITYFVITAFAMLVVLIPIYFLLSIKGAPSEEVSRMIEAAPNLAHRTILMVLYATGIRRTEASLLKVSDVDSKPMVIHVRQGKGSRDRDVPMTPKLLEALREYWRWKRCPRRG
jgi:hypothetical protein